jgi:N-carbamoyl-L-amino-acid hydrolase
MNRRRFSRLAGAAFAGLSVPVSLRDLARMAGGFPRDLQDLRVDGTRLNRRMAALAEFGANDAGGIDRVAFSDADLEARSWVAELFREAGLDVTVDVAGNLVGRRGGSDPGLPPLVLGSHIDSVPGGGNYDGQVGSMGALEVAWTLAEAGVRTRHPLEYVIFPNEEGGKTGSRALAGKVEPGELDIITASGYTIGEGLRRIGGDPARLHEAHRASGSITAFLELHVEQGGVLEAEGQDIGVVEGIVGIMRWNVVVDGKTNHAGTTPMGRRRDALVAAARFIDAVHRTALGMEGSQVATVGRVSASPGAPNVIPGRATLSLEVRDLDMGKIETVFGEIREQAAAIGADTGTTFAFERFYVSEAAPTDPRIRDVVERAARDLGLASRRMPSGAGHDAQSLAHLGPVGMIFVPSAAGISHAPEELTSPEDVTHGADVLLRTLLALEAGALEG